MKENWIYRRGDIYLVDLGTNVGSEQGGCRPVLLLQNDVGNHFAPTLIVAPVSSRYWKKLKQPTHSLIEGIQSLTSPSVVLASLGSKITANGDCSHEIKKRLLLGRKVMTNLDSILKSRDITLPTKVHLVKAMVFPVVMYGCEIWTIRKAEH